MLGNGIHIVGDKFQNFAEHENVYTYSEFLSFVSSNELNVNKIILGQGLSDTERLVIKSLSTHGRISNIDGIDLQYASAEDTHKSNPSNILISDPLEIEKHSIYHAHLLINDDCAEMSDHVTGQHIQGVIYIEASRQLMLAVSEKYFLSKNDEDGSYCALLSLDVKFHQFAFPIKTEICHEVNVLKNKNNRIHANAKTSFFQNNTVVAEVIIEYLFNNKQLLEAKETQLALAALHKASTPVAIN